MTIRRLGFYYVSNPSFPCHQFMVDNYEEVVGADFADALWALDTTMRVSNYKSATDNYTKYYNGNQHPDDVLFQDVCDDLGVNKEDCYLHWDEDTTVMVWFPQNPAPTPVTFLAGERIEIAPQGHQNAGYRYGVYFGPGLIGQAHTEHIRRIAIVPSPSGRRLDGIFLDNAATALNGWGAPLVSGGRVRESGLVIGSTAMNNWHWQHLRDWLVATKAVINAENMRQLINVATYWHEDFLDAGVADSIVEEFTGNPLRDFKGLFVGLAGQGVIELKRRHQKAALVGVDINISAGASYVGTPNQPYNVMQHGTLCGFLVYGEANSTFHIQDITGPYRADWPARITPPAMAVALATAGPRLGTPTGEAELFLSGTTPGGKPYEVWSRMFTRGAVYFRLWGDIGEPSDDTVSFARPGNMRVVNPDGTFSVPADIVLPNGGGAMVII